MTTHGRQELRRRLRLPRGVPPRVTRLIARLPTSLVMEVVAVGRRLHRVRVVGVAAEIAFFTALAVVPMTLAVLAAVGVLVSQEGQEAALATLRQAISLALVGDARQGVLRSLDRLVAGARPGLVSLSVLASVVFASRGFSAVMRGLALVYGTVGRRAWWRDRLTALGFTVAAVAVVAFALATFVVGPLLGALGLADASGIGALAGDLWRVLRWITVPALIVAFLTVLYHDARGGGGGQWTRDLPGALLATGLAGLVAAGYRVVLLVSPRALAASGAPGVVEGQAGEPADVVGAVLVGILATLVLMALISGAILAGAAFNAEHDPDVAAAPPAVAP